MFINLRYKVGDSVLLTKNPRNPEDSKWKPKEYLIRCIEYNEVLNGSPYGEYMGNCEGEDFGGIRVKEEHLAPIDGILYEGIHQDKAFRSASKDEIEIGSEIFGNVYIKKLGHLYPNYTLNMVVYGVVERITLHREKATLGINHPIITKKVHIRRSEDIDDKAPNPLLLGDVVVVDAETCIVNVPKDYADKYVKECIKANHNPFKANFEFTNFWLKKFGVLADVKFAMSDDYKIANHQWSPRTIFSAIKKLDRDDQRVLINLMIDDGLITMAKRVPKNIYVDLTPKQKKQIRKKAYSKAKKELKKEFNEEYDKKYIDAEDAFNEND